MLIANPQLKSAILSVYQIIVDNFDDLKLYYHNIANKYGQNNEVTYSGTAGGFGGSLLNGSVKNSTVSRVFCKLLSACQ